MKLFSTYSLPYSEADFLAPLLPLLHILGLSGKPPGIIVKADINRFIPIQETNHFHDKRNFIVRHSFQILNLTAKRK